MKKVYRIFVLAMFTVFIFNGVVLAERTADIEEREQARKPQLERREPAEQIEFMRSRSIKLNEAAENAEKQGRPEEARELREKAMRLIERIKMQARKIEQGRLHEVEECLDRLRQMTREAEEIRERMMHEIEQRARERLQSLPELPMEPERLRPGIQKRWDNMQNVIGQVREAFMRHLERIEMTIGSLRENMEQMERKINELKAENERLRNELREKERIIRQQQREITEQREYRERQERTRAERQDTHKYSVP